MNYCLETMALFCKVLGLIFLDIYRQLSFSYLRQLYHSLSPYTQIYISERVSWIDSIAPIQSWIKNLPVLDNELWLQCASNKKQSPSCHMKPIITEHLVPQRTKHFDERSIKSDKKMYLVCVHSMNWEITYAISSTACTSPDGTKEIELQYRRAKKKFKPIIGNNANRSVPQVLEQILKRIRY